MTWTEDFPGPRDQLHLRVALEAGRPGIQHRGEKDVRVSGKHYARNPELWAGDYDRRIESRRLIEMIFVD